MGSILLFTAWELLPLKKVSFFIYYFFKCYIYLTTKDIKFTFYSSVLLHVVGVTRAICISDVYEQIPERKQNWQIFFLYTNQGMCEKQNYSFSVKTSERYKSFELFVSSRAFLSPVKIDGLY